MKSSEIVALAADDISVSKMSRMPSISISACVNRYLKSISSIHPPPSPPPTPPPPHPTGSIPINSLPNQSTWMGRMWRLVASGRRQGAAQGHGRWMGPSAAVRPVAPPVDVVLEPWRRRRRRRRGRRGEERGEREMNMSTLEQFVLASHDRDNIKNSWITGIYWGESESSIGSGDGGDGGGMRARARARWQQTGETLIYDRFWPVSPNFRKKNFVEATFGRVLVTLFAWFALNWAPQRRLNDAVDNQLLVICMVYHKFVVMVGHPPQELDCGIHFNSFHPDAHFIQSPC